MRVAVAVLALTALLPACADSGADRTVEAPRLSAARGTVYGAAEGDGALSGVFGVAVAPDGRVVASEPQFARVVVFHADGSFSHVVGRRGRGPGEFSIPAGLSWRGDSLAVLDFQVGLHLFDVDGTYHDRISLAGRPAADASFPLQPVFALPDGSVAAFVPTPTDAAVDGRVTHETWFRTDRTGAVLDTLLSLPLAGRHAAYRAGDQGRSGAHPVPSAPLMAVAPDASSIVVVDAEPAGSDGVDGVIRVTRIAPTGDTVETALRPYTPIPFGDAQRDSVAQAVGQSWADARDLAPGPLIDAVRDQVEWPTSWPPVTAALAGTDGTVWLRREAPVGDSVRWDVLSADLEPQGTVHLPAGLDVKVVARDAVWGIELDDLDVPSIVRYDVGG